MNEYVFQICSTNKTAEEILNCWINLSLRVNSVSQVGHWLEAERLFGKHGNENEKDTSDAIGTCMSDKNNRLKIKKRKIKEMTVLINIHDSHF